MQKHKLHGEKIKNLGPKQWRRSSCWFIEMADGYVHKKDKARRGGVCTLIAERLVIIVGENGILMENRMQWVILKRLLGGDLGVANIYAPNIPKEWCFLWAKMIQKLPRGCRWILASD